MNVNEWPCNLWEDIWRAFPFPTDPRDGEESDEKDFVLYWPNLDNVISTALNERHQKVLHELPPDSPIRVLGLTPRSYNRLIANNIKTVGDLVSYKESTLMHFRGMGKTCVKDIKAALAKYDYELAPEE